ncbi:MAG: AMP-binding protein, partial [bacterium]|nr:AMP-binding protein [bacterium]
HVILEIATMHGFPTETEEEAQMTLDFIKGIKWLHFPYIHILKIYPDTEMETLALKHGVSKEDILASKDLAYHDLPETLPFPKSFTRKYKSDFMNNYFLDKDRLRAVLPVQMKVLTEDALVMKYNAYLPTEINSLQDILELAGLENEMDALTCESRVENSRAIKKRVPEIFHESHAPAAEGNKDKKKILLLDLSQHFSSHSMLYNVSEQPLGLLFLMTFIRQELGGRVGGRIYKSGNDFDSFNELKALVEAYEPDLIGIRSLTFYREFFHESVSLLRQWGIDVPIIAGGPYATSDYASILKDKNVNLVVLGEGEYTMVELLGKMLENDFALPEEAVLRNIRGLVFAKDVQGVDQSLEVLQVDVMEKTIAAGESSNLEPVGDDTNLAYVMYTSGSTGKPKGVMVEHRQVNNNNWWMQEKFTLDAGAVVVQRTNLTFDPSVWEIFWPLAIGASIKIIDNEDRKDVAYLTRLMAEAGEPGKKATIMYCPSTLVTALAHFLEMKRENPRLHLPWLVIGAEPITMEVVKTFYSYFEGKIVNTYGPTECTINNTYYDLSPDDPRGIVPIGRPVANNQVYVLSRELQLLPVGITGEICIAGNSLARGYINNREKTVTHFVDNPFGPGKLYKTGDMGHYLPDGNVVISGRTDDQVKIRGHRIEPGDIETALAGHPYIREAVVVAKTNAELKEDIKECKICGIYSNYPGIKISDEHTCNICENLALYKKLITEYFKTPDDFELKLREGNKSRDGKYDCVLVYACERVATYALYKLLDMGFKVMTVTYDSGHYSQESLDRIKRITSNIGVDHAILRHEHSNRILKESLKVAKTMCKGCIHTSSSLAGEFAFKHNIKFVIGETLSRGQIVENKLFKFMEMGIHNVNEIEKEVKSLMRSVASLDKSIYDIINIDVVNDGSLYDIVEFLDFYRYFDITNEEMVAYLDVKDSYWKNLENRATYSTDCKICSVGDFNHLKELGYHYTGSAKSWEKRLGQATMKEVKDDLKINMSAKEHSEFLDDLGYKEEIQVDKNRKYLCAYYVGVEDVGSVQLKEFLAGEVPDYMVPSYFVQLENIPLTTSGKIDKRALPAPGLSSLMEDYEPPENDVEEKLQLVWQEVLGVDGIGVNDDLFNMGGDSIKAIQIVSKLQKYNMKLEIKDLFLHPTIRKARSYVEPVDAGSTRIPEQGVISGELPFTPIQAWFFQEDFIDSHHFNQAMMLHGKKGFDEAKLRTVFDAVVKHHDALRMVFKPAPDGTGVVQRNRGMEEPLYHLEVVHLEDETDPGAVIPQKALAIQSGINTAEGPLLKLALFKTGSGDHLLIVVHHLVMDGVSWRILLEDLGIGFLQVDEGTTVSLQDKSDSFKDWAETLFQYAQTDAALGELMFWQKQESKGRELRGLPKDKKIAPADRKMKHSLAVDMLLEADYTEKLLKEVNRTFNTEINDILLTALGMAIKEWCRLDRVEILLEGHGREPILEDVDVTRTVGWFTSQYPVLLEMDKDDVPGLIKSVKETLRKIPNKGIGYGILRYLTAAERKGSYDVQSDPEIGFNYLGQFGAGGKSGTDGPFSFSPFGTGETKSPEMEAKHALDINGVISDGRLGMSFVFDRQEFNRENIEELAGLYKSNLEKLIAFCVSADFTEKTAADFDAPDLDTEDLDNIYDELEIE